MLYRVHQLITVKRALKIIKYASSDLFGAITKSYNFAVFKIVCCCAHFTVNYLTYGQIRLI